MTIFFLLYDCVESIKVFINVLYKMFEKIRDHLNDIDKAGQSLAAAQFPIYVEKQKELREKFKSILSVDQNKKEEDEKTEEEKIKNMSKERLQAYKRDKNNKKHVQSMTKQEREDQISNIMSRLYYGLDKMDIPGDFTHLVNTGNETMDKINYYNITLSMQKKLKLDHPELF